MCNLSHVVEGSIWRQDSVGGGGKQISGLDLDLIPLQFSKMRVYRAPMQVNGL